MVLPQVGRVVSGSNWAAFEISNTSQTNVLTHPSFRVTAATATGELVFNSRMDKFPMLSPGARAWIYFPFSNLLFKAPPSSVTLSLFEAKNNRPSDQSEWPTIEKAQFVDKPTIFNLTFPGIGIQFNLINNSKSSALSSDSLYNFFCLDSDRTPIFAGYALTTTSLLPRGSTQILGPTDLASANLTIASCKSISVTLGPIFTP